MARAGFRSVFRGLGKQFEIDYGDGTLAVAGADAVAARVASADDDDLAPTGIHGHRLRFAGDDAFWPVRKSMAWWMPSSSRPGMGRSRDRVAPQQSTSASKSVHSCSPLMSTPA
jgi:hypothetical protein